MTETALAYCWINFREKGTGENALKDERVSTDGAFDEALSGGLNRGLRTAFSSGKDVVRKAGEDGLFGHTFKPYQNRLFVLFYEGKFPEMALKVVPFEKGSFLSCLFLCPLTPSSF